MGRARSRRKIDLPYYLLQEAPSMKLRTKGNLVRLHLVQCTTNRRVSCPGHLARSSSPRFEAQNMLLIFDAVPRVESITTSPVQALFVSNRAVDKYRGLLLLEQPLGLDQSRLANY